MSKTPTRPRDPNQLAKLVIDIASGDARDRTVSGKNPLSVLGRQGGLKGGDARAAALTSEQRSDIAKKAALARWKKHDG